MSTYAITLADVQAAAKRIAGVAHPTPIMTCATLNALAGRKLFFKCEQFQKVGAFKFRGAFNAVMKLTDGDAKKGVVTHSSGNHAQALALAAKLRGIPAHIVMPRNATPAKRKAVEGYGANVVECEPTLAAREVTVAEVRERTGAILIPPYNHPDVMAGQGTTALEMLGEIPDLDAIVCPIGGGGLMTGVAIAAKEIKPALRLFAAEPLGADDAAPNTIADGLLTSMGELTWPIVRDLVETVVTVKEIEIVQAMRLAWERAKFLIEPSSAVAIAAVLTPGFKELVGMNKVGVVLSGGNANLDRLPW
jgi:threonine dehydratase/serine racemase